MSRPRPLRPAVVALVVALAVSLSACSQLGGAKAEPVPTPVATSATPKVEDTQFTRDGTFQSHIDVDGVDFVYTLYPTKSTPRTHEWYPLGNKYFTLTLTAYDLDRKLRDRFATKRKVYLDRISASSTTDSEGADGSSAMPYSLNAQARTITLDPEPTQKRGYGMLVTSPKGAFELRNQKIGPMPLATRLVTLKISASVYIQRRPGSDQYDRHRVTQKVPITIFASKRPTPTTRIPVDAN